MNDELIRAASAAAKALGMNVEVLDSGTPDTPTVLVQMFALLDPLDMTDVEALAFLEGLEIGARIMRERHAELREAANKLALMANDAHVAQHNPMALPTLVGAGLYMALTNVLNALSQLED